MRPTLIWISLAVLGFVLEIMGVEVPVSGTPFLAIALAVFTSSRLRTRPLAKRLFGALEVLRVVLPGLLYAAAAAAALLEWMRGTSLGAGVGFLVGASVAVGIVLSSSVMLSAPPKGDGRVRYVCARCGLGSDRGEGREPCKHCGLFTRIEWSGDLPATEEERSPFTRLWCPTCAQERAAPRGTSECGSCGQGLHIEFNDHATGALETGDGRGLEAR